MVAVIEQAAAKAHANCQDGEEVPRLLVSQSMTALPPSAGAANSADAHAPVTMVKLSSLPRRDTALTR
jgi:hypothetical protein